MKKPAGPRPVFPRYQDQLRRLARRILVPWAGTDNAKAAQLKAIRQLLALMEKQPRLSIETGKRKNRPPDLHDNLRTALPRLLYVYRDHLPEGQPLATLRHLVTLHGVKALRFDLSETDPVTNEDIVELKTLGLDVSRKSHALALLHLGRMETFFPALRDMISESTIDPLSLWAKGAEDPRSSNTGGVFARNFKHVAYLRDFFASGVHPDDCRLEKIHHTFSHTSGQEVVEPAVAPGETVLRHGRFQASHFTLLQSLVINCLTGRKDSDFFALTMGKAMLCLEFGANPDLAPDWSQYDSPRVMLEKGIALVETHEGPDAAMRLRSLKMRMDDLDLARTLEMTAEKSDTKAAPSSRARL
jgi:hypothetical protein